jgi:hypothetical protein
LILVTQSIVFNTNDTFGQVTGAFENILNVENNSELSTFGSTMVSNAVDNLLDYASNTDCNLETDFANSLQNKTYNYLESVTASMLQGEIPGDQPYSYQGYNVDVVIFTVSPCTIDQIEINSTSNAPSVSFQFPDDVPKDCSKLYKVQYYVFNPDLFLNSCEGSPGSRRRRRLDATGNAEIYKSTVALQITDADTGEPTSVGISAQLKLPSTSLGCPPGCSLNSNRVCLCSKLDVFNVKLQIASLFQRSNIALLANVSALTNLKFLKNVLFWGIITFTMWFIVTIVLINLNYKIKNYCALEKLRGVRSRSKAQALKALFMVRKSNLDNSRSFILCLVVIPLKTIKL